MKKFLSSHKLCVMLEDFRLKVFVTLAEEGSFTKAAARLGISQPAVSQNIAELEKTLSRRLFQRMRGAVELTSDGVVFLKYAGSILEAYSSADRMFAQVPSTVVKISVSEELYDNMIEPKLQEFMDLHGQVVFERCLTEAPDLKIFMRPSSRRPFDTPSDCILKLRISISEPSDNVTRESVQMFDVIFQPSPAFECTRLCRLLKEFLMTI